MTGKSESRKPVPKPGMSPLDEAQDLIYDAWEMADQKSCLELARRALKIFPDCADAYVLLAQAARTRAKALELYRKGVEAGERALGREAFERDAGHFWGIAWLTARLSVGKPALLH